MGIIHQTTDPPQDNNKPPNIHSPCEEKQIVAVCFLPAFSGSWFRLENIKLRGLMPLFCAFKLFIVCFICLLQWMVFIELSYSGVSFPSSIPHPPILTSCLERALQCSSWEYTVFGLFVSFPRSWIGWVNFIDLTQESQFHTVFHNISSQPVMGTRMFLCIPYDPHFCSC